jgi:hypothetical protein
MNRYLILVLSAFLYSCSFFKEQRTIHYNDLQGYEKLKWQQDSAVLVMPGDIAVVTSPLSLKKGKYTLVFSASGNAAVGRLPHIVISLGIYTVRDMEIREGLNEYKLNFEIPKDVDTPLTMIFDNDFYDGKEDRNVFLYFPFFIDDF